MALIQFTCDGCGNTAERESKFYKYNVKRGRKNYCSYECYVEQTQKKQTYYCKFCSKPVERKPSQVEESGNVFCSSSCAAKYNNKGKKRLQRPSKHCACGKRIQYNSEMCSECRNGAKRRGVSNTLLNTTVDQIKEAYNNKSSLSFAAKVRGYGKTIYEASNMPKYCVNCGYSKHYEVCHIKAVKDFPDTATMAEVHSLDNLIALCPNCHWEYDHSMLTLDEILRKQKAA